MPATITRLAAALSRRTASRVTQPPGGFLTGAAITAGDLVTIDASGRVKPAAAPAANIAPGVRVGISKTSRLSADPTGTLMEVEAVDDQCIFRVPLSNASAVQAWSNAFVGQKMEGRNVGGIYTADTSQLNTAGARTGDGVVIITQTG